MKIKAAILTLALVLTAVLSCVFVSADNGVKVTVSIANGELVLTEAEITVTDIDGDGALTINDTLIAAHTAKFEGGADGFASENGDYGLAITKLWGVENGGSYGYYVNNVSAMGLSDPVKDSDRVYAFIYTDTTAFSDAYCFFDKADVAASAGKSIELTLSAAGYDESWNPVTLPVEGAVITVNGKKTDVKTDKDGKAVITIDSVGTYTISAVSDSQTLVPPVCIAAVTEAAPQTSDTDNTVLVVLSVASVLAAAALMKRKSVYAK